MAENQDTHHAQRRIAPELLDVNGVADMLGVPHGRVYQFAYVGTIPAPVKLGGMMRWSRRGLLRWIDAGCPPLQAPPVEPGAGEQSGEPHLPPSRVKARAAYEWALKNIPDAETMTYRKLFDAILASDLPADLRGWMPPNATAFERYLNAAGVRKHRHRIATPRQLMEMAIESSEAAQ